ncbi:MAG TPA: LppP/LprE family lipoprotein [Solirubrobacteraceae bacterium]|nr:LppP/LprE family lipoprotein [Solirubrobacteraceae bacterium]
MRRTVLRAASISLALAAAALLAACGSSTKTVTETSAPPVAQTTGATTTRSTQTQATSAQTTQTQTQTTPTSTTTRTAPEPAFTEHEAKAEGAGGAAAVVRARGYTPNDTSEYHSNQTLQVLVGTQASSSDGYGQQAFFFVDGHYVGTDTKLPSAKVKVLDQGDTEVTLGYPLYRHGDALSDPSGGEAHVTFQLNNGKLVALQTIPSASERN